MEKKCENCVWFDQCGCDKACEYYDPASNEERESDEADAYEQDLRQRHDIYVSQVEEQDS